MQIPRITLLGNCWKKDSRNFSFKPSQSVFHVQNQEYAGGGEVFLFIPIYSSLFRGVLGKSQGV